MPEPSLHPAAFPLLSRFGRVLPKGVEGKHGFEEHWVRLRIEADDGGQGKTRE